MIAGMRNLALAIIGTTTVALAEPVDIVVLGDSLTAGYGLPAEHGFIPQMQAWLDRSGVEARLINAGVSGDTTAGGLARVDWTLTPNVDAMVVALGGNDYLRGLDPAVSRANLDAILTKAEDAGLEALLVGVTAGANYGADYRDAFNGMYVDLAQAYDIPMVPTFFEGLLAVAGTQDRALDYMQADGIHPNAKGVKAIVAALGPRFETLANAARDGE